MTEIDRFDITAPQRGRLGSSDPAVQLAVLREILEGHIQYDKHVHQTHAEAIMELKEIVRDLPDKISEEVERTMELKLAVEQWKLIALVALASSGATTTVLKVMGFV